ncbi:MAG: class I SAM-dependent methyltransferase [Bacteroidota bacterium]
MSIIKKVFRRAKRILSNQENKREALIKMMPANSICAEIGVWKGNFSKRILSINQPKKLHLIDPYEYQTGFGKRLFGGKVAQSQADMDEIFESVKEKFKGQPVQFHRGYSDDAIKDFEDGYFDWVYVDGNHYYDFVMRDLENYFPKIKSDGFLTGDDYKWTSEELNGDFPVERAVQDFIKKYEAEIEFTKLLGEGQFVIKKKG